MCIRDSRGAGVAGCVDGFVRCATLVASGGPRQKDTFESEGGQPMFCMGFDLQLYFGAADYKVLRAGGCGLDLSSVGCAADRISGQKKYLLIRKLTIQSLTLELAVLALATVRLGKPWLTPKRLMLTTPFFSFDKPLGQERSESTV